jgi:hypothetical protein
MRPRPLPESRHALDALGGVSSKRRPPMSRWRAKSHSTAAAGQVESLRSDFPNWRNEMVAKLGGQTMRPSFLPWPALC